MEESDGESATSRDELQQRSSARLLSVQLPISTLIGPRSVAVNFETPLPMVGEAAAIRKLIGIARERSTENYLEFDLDDFEIYTDSFSDRKSPRLTSLNFLGSDENKNSRMFFDGILSVGSCRFYVQHVPFAEAPVDKYGIEYDTVGQSIWIRSMANEDRKLYYRLRRPSIVYKRFFTPYIWIVDLGKHFVDFCSAMVADGRDVCVSHFRATFIRWVRRMHPCSAAVGHWYGQYGRDDFRTAVTTHSGYLWKELSSIIGEERGRSLQWFREVTCQLYKNWTPSVGTGPIQPTVVTPYIFDLFSHLAIGDYLKETHRNGAACSWSSAPIFSQRHAPFLTGPVSTDQDEARKRIQPGDVISITRDPEGPGSGWTAEGERSPFWYALVHRVTTGDQGQQLFDVAWLYGPEHTPCRQMRYPWSNELFLSAHCTCDEEDNSIEESDVAGVHLVEWFGSPDTAAHFFVRQTYIHGDKRWVQLRGEHTLCDRSRANLGRRSLFFRESGTKVENGWTTSSADSEASADMDSKRQFSVRETVLAVLSKNDTLTQPFEIVAFYTKDGPGKRRRRMVKLRRLLRRREVDPAARKAEDNELVHTQQFVSLSVRNIIGRCAVRVFEAGTKIPSPYNRAGAGNLFFITHKQLLDEATEPIFGKQKYSYVPLEDGEKLSLRQGFDPMSTCQRKLRSLDLFCGCGNLARGLEESRIIETRWVNDIWDKPIHTCMANTSAADAVAPFLGSADELLARALHGQYSREIPHPGEVDLISGGSPCQGFSALTTDKNTPKQFKNRSMIASFASMIDFYRPKYGILENVPEIVAKDNKQGKRHREDIFGQLLCSLVGLGYQVNIMLGNAWSYGAPQRRRRVFLLFAAPEVTLPKSPLPSHGSPPGISQATVGRVSNGDWVSETWEGPTAFPFVSMGKATADLREGPGAIADGIVDVCIPYPDHRICAGTTDKMRYQLSYISKFPYGMNLIKSTAQREEGPKSEILKALFSESVLKKRANTNSFKRVDPTGLLATVTTSCNVEDGWSGPVLHWEEKRPLTILEVRRAQGIPDEEVLIGQPAAQWKMVGNAVARPLALALGLAVRESWLGSLYEDQRGPGGASYRPQSSAGYDSLSQQQLQTTMTTVTTTTTTTTTVLGSPTTSPDLPFKKNRIFKTNVQRTIISDSSEVIAVSDAAGWHEKGPSVKQKEPEREHVSGMQPQKRRHSIIVIDLTQKRSRYDSESDATMVGDS